MSRRSTWVRHPFFSLSFVAGSCALWLFLATASAAMPQTEEEIANYRAGDRQEVLEAGAKKEGAVQIYGTGAQIQPLVDAFAKKYPFVKITFFRGDGPAVTRRFFEEYKTARYTVDVLDVGSTSLVTIRDLNLSFLQPFQSPEMASMRQEAIEMGATGPLWANNYESYLNLGYNTKALSEGEVPRTYDDLLDPKWRGRMAMAGSSGLVNWIGAALAEKGEPYIRKLGAQDIKIFNVAGRAMSNLVVSGEVPLSPAIYDSHMIASQGEGASVSWRPLGGTYATTGGVALALNAPHPHAAMLYIDFMISKVGQEMYKTIGYASARTDVESTKQRPSKVYYLAQQPNYAEDYEKWSDLGRQVFGKGETPAPSK